MVSSKIVKRISILGSTGSIGTSTLKVAKHLGSSIEVVALAAGSNSEKLEAQIREFRPKVVALFDKTQAFALQKKGLSCKVLGGMEGVLEVASLQEVDCVVAAITGSCGLKPTFAAILAGKQVALANKEVLVCAGELMMRTAKEHKAEILPVDSEHSALFQCLKSGKQSEVSRLILTASGGPFREFSKEQLSAVTCMDALKHPNWAMGPKITIDCSTLMNKGLEMIEAHYLFNIPIEKIDIVIHPESIIHSMVEFVDGSILAQMGEPTMCTPIQYALTYPHRLQGLLSPFDFFTHSKLQFHRPDLELFKCLKLAYWAIKQGMSFPCYMNGVNEVLVAKFLRNELSWCEIGERLELLLSKHCSCSLNTLDDVLAMDDLAKQEARNWL